MAEATWGEGDEPPEAPKHTKEELVRALFRANAIIRKLGFGDGDMTLQQLNGQVARHLKFMFDGEEYQDFIKVQEKLAMEEAVG